MERLIIFIFIFLGIVGAGMCKAQTKTYLNTGTIFCFMWGITGAFSNTGLYGMYLPTTIVNIGIVMGILLFGIIYCILSSNIKMNKYYIRKMDCRIRYKLINLINISICIYILPFCIRALYIIKTKGFIYLRAIAGLNSDDLGTTSLSNLILFSICYPSIIVSCIIGSILFFQGHKEGRKVLIFSFFNLTLYCLTTAARNGFVTLIIIFILCYIRYYRTQTKGKVKVKVLTKNQRNLIKIISIVCVMVLLWISFERGTSSDNIIKNIYLYHFGGLAYLSQLLENLSSYQINSVFFCGLSTFGFVWNLIALPLNQIGFSVINSDFIINSTLTWRNLIVGEQNLKLNAMSTIFFPFLMDWGYFGFIIGPILLAIFSYYIDKKAYVSNKIRWHSIEILWLYTIYRTVFKWNGVSISFFFMLFFIVIFTKK